MKIIVKQLIKLNWWATTNVFLFNKRWLFYRRTLSSILTTIDQQNEWRKFFSRSSSTRNLSSNDWLNMYKSCRFATSNARDIAKNGSTALEDLTALIKPIYSAAEWSNAIAHSIYSNDWPVCHMEIVTNFHCRFAAQL